MWSLVLVALAAVAEAAKSPPEGMTFVGVGYNLVKGNPDEGVEAYGGVDPGILTTYRIFELTYKTNRMTDDRTMILPDQISYFPRDSRASSTTDKTYYGAKSYQSKLKIDINAEASGGIPKLMSYAFTGSALFKRESSESKNIGSVYHEERSTYNFGSARYRSEMAASEKYGLGEGFRHAGCQLPEIMNPDFYKRFFDSWGTHVITQVHLGEKHIYRNETTRGQMFKMAMSDNSVALSLGGSYSGHSASLKMDVDKFSESKSSSEWNTSKSWKFDKGNKGRPEPIKLDLQTIDTAFLPHYWVGAPCAMPPTKLSAIRQNIKKGLEIYPQMLGLKIPTDPILQIPLTWPKGTYGLPDTNVGCPNNGSSFNWKIGARVQQTGRDNKFYEDHHWPQDTLESGRIKQRFCIKSSDVGELWWQPGQYCIFKVKQCPAGFEWGAITWDDYGSEWANRNQVGGYLPDGVYKKNTKIEYCCRNDGPAGNPIYLPTGKNFYLFAVDSQCQQVRGMKVLKDMFLWDDQFVLNQSNLEGLHPYDTSTTKRNHELTYCYYYKD